MKLEHDRRNQAKPLSEMISISYFCLSLLGSNRVIRAGIFSQNHNAEKHLIMWIQSVPPSSFILPPYSSLPILYNGIELLLQLSIQPPLTLPAQAHCLHIFLHSELSWTSHGGAQLKSSEMNCYSSLYHLPATPCSLPDSFQLQRGKNGMIHFISKEISGRSKVGWT